MSGFGEIIGIVSAVTALVELSGKILVTGYSFTKDVIDAPLELRQLLSEVSSLDVLLNKICDFAHEAKGSDVNALPSALSKIASEDRLNQCDNLLRDVMLKVTKCEGQKGHRLGNFRRQVQWPFEKKEVAELIQKLQRLKSYFQDAILIDMAKKVDKIVESQVMTQLAKESESLMAWICPANTDVNTALNDASRARHPGTCQWLLNDVKYIEWKKSQLRQILWINGPAGSGKTVMSATVIQDLESTFQTPNNAVLYFYLKHEDASKQSIAAVLSQAIRQLLDLQPECINHVKTLKDATNLQGERAATVKDQIKLLKIVSRRYFHNVFLVVDALDEAASTNEVLNILDSFSAIAQGDKTDDSSASVSVIFTSRRMPYIQQKLNSTDYVDIDIDSDIHPGVHQDVRSFIVTRVQAMAQGLSRPGTSIIDLEQQAINTVAAKAGGLFLQAKYHLDFLSDAPNIKRFRKKLDGLPDGLKDTYNLILSQIRQKHFRYMDEILRMLHWIAGVREPTTVSTLAQIAVIEPDDTSFDPEAVWPDTDQLLLMLSSLVTVDCDRGASLVRFSHYTVREHLCSSEIRASTEKAFYIDPKTLDKELARVTLQYLSFEQFAQPDPAYESAYTTGFPRHTSRDALAFFIDVRVQDRDRCQHMTRRLAGRSEADFKKKLEDYPVLEYASEFWVDHVRSSRVTLDELVASVPNLEGWFSDSTGQDPRYMNWVETHSSGCRRADHCYCKQPPLYFALLFGVLPWVKALAADPKLSPSVWHSQFQGGWNPMTLAAASQSTMVVNEVLLHAGADKVDDRASEKAKKNLTGLLVAAELGDSRMIEHLLSKGASPWALPISGTTPLHRIAGTSSMRGLELLYTSVEEERRSEYINVRTWDSWTALMNAAMQRRTSAVKFLLEHGADWSTKTLQGHTALTMSIQVKHMDIQHILMQWIEKDSRVELRDAHLRAARDLIKRTQYPGIKHVQPDRRGSPRPNRSGLSTDSVSAGGSLTPSGIVSDQRSRSRSNENVDRRGGGRRHVEASDAAERCRSLTSPEVNPSLDLSREKSESPSDYTHNTDKHVSGHDQKVTELKAGS